MNVLLNTIQIHDSNTKKCANSVISFEPYSNMVFSEEVKITKFADSNFHCIQQNVYKLITQIF